MYGKRSKKTMGVETTRRNEIKESMDKKIFLTKRAVELDNEEKILQSLQKPEKQLKMFRDIIDKKIKNNEHANATKEVHEPLKQPSNLGSFACIRTDTNANNGELGGVGGESRETTI